LGEQNSRGPDKIGRENVSMASVTEFRCEVCGTVTANPIHWFVIRCSSTELTVIKWNAEAAAANGSRHYCGEAHAQVYISRWLEAACAPAMRDFSTNG
jgi:hypothetical protein